MPHLWSFHIRFMASNSLLCKDLVHRNKDLSKLQQELEDMGEDEEIEFIDEEEIEDIEDIEELDDFEYEDE